MHVVRTPSETEKRMTPTAVQDALDLGGVVVLESGKTYRVARFASIRKPSCALNRVRCCLQATTSGTTCPRGHRHG
jgi:hypothetical protein